jgi:hypothetical protein
MSAGSSSLISDGKKPGASAFTLMFLRPVHCAATASDEDSCLAMLNRREGETLYQLLLRLDQAIDRAWNEGEFTDEINGND